MPVKRWACDCAMGLPPSFLGLRRNHHDTWLRRALPANDTCPNARGICRMRQRTHRHISTLPAGRTRDVLPSRTVSVSLFFRAGRATAERSDVGAISARSFPVACHGTARGRARGDAQARTAVFQFSFRTDSSYSTSKRSLWRASSIARAWNVSRSPASSVLAARSV